MAVFHPNCSVVISLKMDGKTLNGLNNKELWKLFPIILSEYRKCWPQRYKTEEAFLINALGKNNIYRLSHIGSTSVPGLLAKPTIDMLLEVEQGSSLEPLIKGMEASGYIYLPQPDKPAPHMMFLKGYTPNGFEGQSYHVHIRYPGDWDEFYFRDYLIGHPNTAREYGELKFGLKSEYEHDRDGYTAAKTDFIKRYTHLARMEFPGRYEKTGRQF